MIWLLLVPFLLGIAVGVMATRPQADTILCTPQDVEAAIETEFASGRWHRLHPRHAVIPEEEVEEFRQRIAANLVQLVEQKGDKTA